MSNRYMATSAAPGTDVDALGGGGGSVASTDITDSSATGRSVLTGDSAAGRAALGVDALPAWAVPPARASLYFPAPNGGLVGTPAAPGPHWCDGASLVMMFWPTANTGSGGGTVVVSSRESACHLRLNDSADPCRFGVYYSATGVVALPAACSFAGALNAPHVLAMTVTGGELRASFDGGAVDVLSAFGAPAAPTTQVLSIGTHSDGAGYPADHIQIMAFRTYSTPLSDGDLVAAGASAVRAAGTLPALTGTVSFNLAARDVPPTLVEYEYGALLLSGSTIKRRRTR